MTGTELAKKLNLPNWKIRHIAKKINPYCYQNGTEKIFSKKEIKEIEEYIAELNANQHGVKRITLAKEYGLKYKHAYKITKAMGIPQKQGGSTPFIIPDDRIEEFRKRAAEVQKELMELAEGKRHIETKEQNIRAMYDRILKEGYVSAVEVHKTIPGNNDSVLSKFHNMGLYIYDDYITVPALNVRGNPNGKTKKVRVFKANETIWNEWRKEQNAIQKNGHIDTNDRSITTARRVG